MWTSTKVLSVTTVASILLTGFVSAETMTFKEARKSLPRNIKSISKVADHGFLDEKTTTILETLRASIPYYGALAISPDEGIFVEYISAVGGHHSSKAAQDAALKQCNANRKSSSAPCVVVLEVAPKNPRGDLSLSVEAQEALLKSYRKLDKPRAFAISPATGAYGFDLGDGARAVSKCAAGGAKDCEIIVAD